MKEALTILAICALAACGADNKSEAPAAAPTVEATAAPTAEASAAPAPPPPKSLFDRVNGDAGITKFVNDAIANVKADKRVAKYLPRDAKKLTAFHDDLVAQIEAGAGGPASTRGDAKAEAVAMKIKAKDFDFIVEDVGKAAASDLPEAEAKEVMDALTGMKDSLTTKK